MYNCYCLHFLHWWQASWWKDVAVAREESFKTKLLVHIISRHRLDVWAEWYWWRQLWWTRIGHTPKQRENVWQPPSRPIKTGAELARSLAALKASALVREVDSRCDDVCSVLGGERWKAWPSQEWYIILLLWVMLRISKRYARILLCNEVLNSKWVEDGEQY